MPEVLSHILMLCVQEACQVEINIAKDGFSADWGATPVLESQ